MNDERWKDIEGFEGYYQVSNIGRIRSVDRCAKSYNGERIVKGKVLKPVMSKKTGYYQINLYKGGKKRGFNVHFLVAMAFVEQNGKPFVNHKDGRKTNNVADNLEWVTNRENQHHALKLGLNKNYGAKNYKARCVRQLDGEGNLIKEWGCINDAVRELGIQQPNVVKCCKGERKTAGGFVWEYAEVKSV